MFVIRQGEVVVVKVVVEVVVFVVVVFTFWMLTLQWSKIQKITHQSFEDTLCLM